MEAKWEEQLLSLRALTDQTGALHEAQVLQLKMWGGIAFHHLKLGQWTAEVDVPSKSVSYKLEKGKRPTKAVFARTIVILDESIHWLLGDQWQLTVAENGNLIYQGQRIIKNVAAERRQRASTRKD